ncbi:hypothetical protein LUZ60_011342 [Juncus effusus]|nr:hypothetical protein LUZ60_011342 [Juncus effusus]
MERELLETFEAAKKAADAAAEGDGATPEAERCVDALKRLRKIRVTTDVLVSTQVGKRLRYLTKHPNSEIQSMASDLLAFWKNIVIEENSNGKRNGPTSSSETDRSSKSTNKTLKIDPNSTKSEPKSEKSQTPKSQTPKPQTLKIEPKSEKNPIKTEPSKPQTPKHSPSPSMANKKPTPIASNPPKLNSLLKSNDVNRDKIRGMLAEAFSKVPSETLKDSREEIRNLLEEINSCDHLRAAVTVESAMYEKLGSSIGSQKVKYRSILFNLRAENNTDFRRRVLLGQVKAERLADLKPEEMASDARRMENDKIKDKALFDCERAGAPKATTDQFKCGRCGQRKTTYYQLQTRSADEPMTTFVTCVNCNNHWKFC